MGLSFTRAPTVAKGDKITSAQFNALANAFNDRLKSGIGDGAWRVAMFWFNLWRQVRNPDESGFVFPPQGEWWEIYGLLDPENNPGQWPIAGPGEPEGANIGNPAMQFVYGNPALVGEADRLTDIQLTINGQPPATLTDFWTLGKLQRGVIDPDNNLQNVPAFAVAQSHFQIVTPTYSPHGKAYGGYFPTPIALLEDCGDDESNGEGIPSFEIFFTGLRADLSTAGYHGTVTLDGQGRPVVTYAGSCPAGTLLTASGHVLGMARLPFTTLVAVNDGAGGYFIDRFPTADWIEGPYTGDGVLTRRDGGQLNRALWAFIRDFRGTPEQRKKDNFNIEKIAFSNQEFYTRQYNLAPNLARLSGAELDALYPQAAISGQDDIGKGELLPFTVGGAGKQHVYRDGFVMAGVFAKAEKLFESTSVEVLDGDQVVAILPLEPDSDGNAEAMLWLTEAITPDPLKVRMGARARFTSPDGLLLVEATEQLAYKPEYWDGYLVLREEASLGGDVDSAGVDGRGVDTANSKALYDAYAKYGCIVNQATDAVRGQAEWVNDNPVYDAARRLTLEHARIVARRQFLSYEVSGGKSILRFKRYAYGLKNQKADCFIGIAPSYNPLKSGELVNGETYIVRATGQGRVTYRGGTYGDGQKLTASTVQEFTASGDAELFVYDGIRARAHDKGFSNEWVMSFETHVYHPSFSSNWKPDAYGDYFTWNQRCHFHSGTATNRNFRRHVDYNYKVDVSERDDGNGWDNFRLPETVQGQLVSPEAPSGYNYAHNANNSGGSPEFKKSCQIYKAPYEIESATVEFSGGEEIVKLVFKKRFQSHSTAPATVAQDSTSWSAGEVTDLKAEDYRTDDNAIREYALHDATSINQCTFKTGDSGTLSSVTGLPDNPFGSCYPHFIFTHLIPKPKIDLNTTIDQADTRCTVDAFFQMEVFTRAICEGFIDGKTSEEITCATGQGSLYDYTIENLCFDGFSGRNISALPLLLRDAGHSGFGPLVNAGMYAEVFNRQSSTVNLLTRARAMLPFSVQCRLTNLEGLRPVSGVWPPGATCTGSGKIMAVWSGSPPPATSVVSVIDWDDCGDTVGSYVVGGLTYTCELDGSFNAGSAKTVAEYRVAVSPDYLDAVPEAWRDEIASLGGFLATRTSQIGNSTCTKVFSSGLADGCCAPIAQPCPGFYFDSGEGYTCETTGPADEVSCVLVNAGTLDVGTAPAGQFEIGRSVSDDLCGTSTVRRLILTVKSDPGFYIAIPLTESNEV